VGVRSSSQSLFSGFAGGGGFFRFVITDCCLDSIFSQYRAMNLDRRQGQFGGDIGVFD